MKRTFLAIMAIAATTTCFAENVGSTNLPDDSTKVMTLDDIVSMETDVQQKKTKAKNSMKTWSKTSFFNISKNIERFSSNEFPTTKEMGMTGRYSARYKNNFGIGLQSGHTFNFHKRPIGDVAFIGLDYTWLDLNYSHYEAEKNKPLKYAPGNNSPYNLPWYNEKLVFNYGMSLGPSITLYPFTPLGINATSKIRLQAYWHFGASGEAIILKDIQNALPKKMNNSKNTAYSLGYDVFHSIGFNFTWDFVGIGYELRQTYTSAHYPQADDFDKSTIEFSQQFNRVYLQFRF